MFAKVHAALALLALASGAIAAQQPEAQAESRPRAPASASTPGSPQSSPLDVAEIRRLRIAYNEALEARDVAAVREFLAPEMVELSGVSVQAGSNAVARSYAEQEFQDPAFIAYDRITDSIELAGDGLTAAERGHWRGRYRQPDGSVDGNRGVYQAGWTKRDGRWRIRTESYIQLHCAPRSTCS
jgi:ketosteroid isomerase-like protein